MKKCKKCQAEKPLDQFRKTHRNKDGYQTWCKECKSLYSDSLYRMPTYFKHKLSKETFLQILKDQDYRCKICQNPLASNKGTNIDHDHTCCPGDNSCGNCIRGILCTGCNVGLGMFRDSIPTLIAAAKYLETNEIVFTDMSLVPLDLVEASYDI